MATRAARTMGWDPPWRRGSIGWDGPILRPTTITSSILKMRWRSRSTTSCGLWTQPRPARRHMTCAISSPAPTIEFTSHIVRPEAILAIARQYYGKSPQAFLLAIRGYQFEFVEELTPGAAGNLRVALTMLADKIRASQAAALMNIGLGEPAPDNPSDRCGRARQGDPAQGAGGCRLLGGRSGERREGERTALRIKPDAILAELMTDRGRCGNDDFRRLKRMAARSPATSSARPVTR